MKSSYKITIGIPVFNDEKYIARCIESVLAQNLDSMHIIISDNNSDDQTSKICQDFASKFEKITYIRQKENIGMHDNFRYLLKLCKTEYFMWLASDDWISHNFIKDSYDFLSTNHDYVLATTTSAYYNPADDKFLLATSTTSIESTNANDRAIEYVKNLTDKKYLLYIIDSISLIIIIGLIVYGIKKINNITYDNLSINLKIFAIILFMIFVAIFNNLFFIDELKSFISLNIVKTIFLIFLVNILPTHIRLLTAYLYYTTILLL